MKESLLKIIQFKIHDDFAWVSSLIIKTKEFYGLLFASLSFFLLGGGSIETETEREDVFERECLEVWETGSYLTSSTYIC